MAAPYDVSLNIGKTELFRYFAKDLNVIVSMTVCLKTTAKIQKRNQAETNLDSFLCESYIIFDYVYNWVHCDCDD